MFSLKGSMNRKDKAQTWSFELREKRKAKKRRPRASQGF